MADKVCKVCGETKPPEEFYAAAGMSDGRRSDCKACNLAAKKRRYDAEPAAHIARVRQWQLENPDRVRATRRARNAHPERKRKQRDGYYRRTFGLSADEVDAMIDSQGGVCPICRRAPEREASWHVDHDHATGAVRGVLCIDCNHGLGKLGDSIERLEAAIAYLRAAA